MFILQITATLNLVILIPLLSALVSIIVGIATILRVRHENKEKMATKGYVLEKVSTVELSIVNLSVSVDKNKDYLEKTIKEHKLDNIREHEDIKREFTALVGSINEKIGIIANLYRETK